jgi:hypothetical protein
MLYDVDNPRLRVLELESLPAKRLKTIGLVCLAAYCATLTVDGALRWFLDSRGIAAALYLRDLLPVAAIVLAALTARGEAYLLWQRLFATTACCFFFWLVWGNVHGTPLLQGLFGVKTLLSIPAGMALALLALGRSITVARFSIVAGGVALAGVVIDYFMELPWAGVVYEIGDLRIEAQREWNIDNVVRNAGFSRASFDVGSQLAVLGAVVLASRLGGLTRAAFTLAMFAGILLTTSRSSLVAFAALLLAFACARLFGNRKARVILMPILWLPVAIVGIAYAFPGVTDVIAALDQSGTRSTASWAMRTEGNWLESFGMLPSSPSLEWIFGLGAGSIGAAQKPFEPDMYMSPDNLFIYLFVSFGLVGALLVFVAMTSAWYHSLRFETSGYAFVLPVVATAGIFISAIENVFIGMALGLVVGDAALRRLHHFGPHAE